MANTLDTLVADVQQEETVEASLITLLNGLAAQIKSTVPGLTPAQQDQIDALVNSVTSDSATMTAAIAANTPAAS